MIYLLSATARRAVEHAPAQLPPGWREVSHAEYMAAWATEDAAALVELQRLAAVAVRIAVAAEQATRSAERWETL